MIASYFFIPASHPNLKKKAGVIKADYLIIDFEDATLPIERTEALKKLKDFESKEKLWIRPAIFDNSNHDTSVFLQLIKVGYRNFIIPKCRTLSQLNYLESLLGNHVLAELRIVLLVENPECLLNLRQIIEGSLMKIEGIGFGSQDYCTETGMKHTFDYLRIPRFQIMNTAKAFGLKCVDIACMDTQAGNIFKDEITEAFQMGFDGKFLIHPSQLEVLRKFSFYSTDEIQVAEKVLNEYNQLGRPAVFVYNNKAIEPPHIKHFSKIIKWSKKHES